MDEYALDHVYPDFDLIIEKASKYSPNLMLFLPRNTSITDLVSRLSKFQNKLIGDKRMSELKNYEPSDDYNSSKLVGELSIEIQSLAIGGKITAIVVYTGDLAEIGHE